MVDPLAHHGCVGVRNVAHDQSGSTDDFGGSEELIDIDAVTAGELHQLIVQVFFFAEECFNAVGDFIESDVQCPGGLFVCRPNDAVVWSRSGWSFRGTCNAFGSRFATSGTGGHLFEFSDCGHEIHGLGSERVDGAAQFFSGPLSERFGLATLLLSPLAGQCGDPANTG